MKEKWEKESGRVGNRKKAKKREKEKKRSEWGFNQ